MYKNDVCLDMDGPQPPTAPTLRRSTPQKISPLTLLRDLSAHRSLTMRELTPFLQFISRKQLSRLHLERLPAIGVPAPHTLLGR